MLTEQVLASVALANATGSTSRNGPAVDVRGYLNVAFGVHLGAVAAGGSHTVKIQGSNDGSTWSDLEGVEYAITPATAENVGVLDISHPRFRYLRLTLTADGSNDVTISAIAYRAKANREPVTYADPVSVSATRFHAPEAVGS